MLGALRIGSKVVFAPVWVLWRGYRVLWWAFDDSDQRRAESAASLAPPGAPPAASSADEPAPQTDAPRHGVEQNAAFEITDSTPRPAPEPVGTLRCGFAAALAVSVLAAIDAADRARTDHLSHAGAWALWGWASILAAVVSIIVVRHVAARQAAHRPRTVLAHARVAALGVKDAAWSAGRSACGAGVRVATGCRACVRGARSLAASRPVDAARRGVAAGFRRVASLVKRAPQTSA